MESRRIFLDGMDNDPADYNVMQDFIQGSMDHVVADGVTADRKYAGFAAVKTGSSQVTVQPGRLYVAGKVYALNSATVFDFLTTLPTTTKKIATVAVWGTEVETGATQREFLIDEETNASQPRTVALERARVANIGLRYGVESADPVAPIIEVGLLAVVQVTLSPAGVDSVTMVFGNELDSVSSVVNRVNSLEDFRDDAAPQIVSLSSDLAKVAEAIRGNSPIETTSRILQRIAVIEAKDGIPTAATDSAADFFLTTAKSDTINLNYQAKIQEGVQFADEAAATTALAIFNPLDANAKVVSGTLFPAFTRSLRLDNMSKRTADVAISSFSYQTNEMVQKTVSRTRIRYGERFVLAPTSNVYWVTGSYEIGAGIFIRDGEYYNTSYGAYVNYSYVREPYYWYDTYEETYWDTITVNHSVAGAQVAETFLNANDMWLEAVGLWFTQLASSGTVNLAVCEVTTNGTPDLNKVVSVQTINRSDLKLAQETVIGIQPVFLTGGKRYAIVLTTAAAHSVATTAGENFSQGTFFYVLDGAYQQGDGTRDLCFRLYSAKFNQARAIVNMGSLSLSGGITDVDVLADTIVPKSTSLTYEVQIGATWYPLNGDTTDASVLGTIGNVPPLLPIRAVFSGTPDVMPAVKLSNSTITVSRPRNTFKHISTARTLPASSTQIRFTARLQGFNATYHTAVGKLLTGGSFATANTANSFSDVTNSDGTVDRTWVFNLGSGVTTYKIQIEGATTTVLKTFSVQNRKDWAL